MGKRESLRGAFSVAYSMFVQVYKTLRKLRIAPGVTYASLRFEHTIEYKLDE